MNEVYRDIEKHIPYLRRYAGALTRDPSKADDLVQDTILNALSKCHLYRVGSNLRAWLSTILRNQHITGIRHRGREGIAVDPDSSDLALAVRPNQQHRLTVETVQNELKALPDEQQNLIELVALEDRSYRDLAKRYGLSLGTVKSRIHRGRSRLRDALEGGPNPRENSAHRRSEVAHSRLKNTDRRHPHHRYQKQQAETPGLLEKLAA